MSAEKGRMARQTTVRPTTLAGTLKAVLVLLVVSLLAALMVRPATAGIGIGCGVFLVYRWVVVREVICRQYRRGVLLTKDGRLSEALDAFTRSEHIWADRPWLDEHRAWLLASAGRWPYQALSRYNRAYCLVRLGRGGEAEALLSDLLTRHPDMTLARELRDAVADGRAGAPQPVGLDWGDLHAEPDGGDPS